MPSKFAFLFIFIAPFYVNACSQSPFYNGCSKLNETGAGEWMANIPDDIQLNYISVPGTHDSCALHGGTPTQTQVWSLEDQLQVGIRFLDIRPRNYGDGTLPIHHGPIFQKIYFSEIVQILTDYLKNHVTEVLLMRVEEEYHPHIQPPNCSLSEAIIDTIEKYGDRNMWWSGENIPKLKDVRGKIVMFREYDGSWPGISYPGSRFDVEDDYQLPNLEDLAKKFNEISNHLNLTKKALNSGDASKYFVTFTSGTGILSRPYQVALYENQHTYNFIMQSTNEGNDKIPLGIVIMDFPGTSFIYNVIVQNYH